MLRYLLVLMVTVTGCNYTANYQACTARTSCDLATTTIAEESHLTTLDMENIARIAMEIELFLDSGEVGILTSGQLATLLTGKVPMQYRAYFTAAFAYLSTNKINVVPSEVLRLVKNAVYGVRTAAEKYKCVE